MSNDFRPRVLPADECTSIADAIAAGAGTRSGTPGPSTPAPSSSSSRPRVCAVGAAPGSRWRASGAPSSRTPRRCSHRPSWSTPPEGEPGSFKDRTILQARPVPGDRGRADRGPHGRRRLGDHRHQGVVHRCGRPAATCRGGGGRRGLDRRGARHRVRGSGRVPLRRRDRTARGHRRAPAVPPHRAALPRGRRRGLRRRSRRGVREPLRGRGGDGRTDRRVRRTADAGRQRRDLRQPARHRGQRRRLVPGARHHRVPGHGRLHRERRHRPPRRRRGRARHAAAAR